MKNLNQFSHRSSTLLCLLLGLTLSVVELRSSFAQTTATEAVVKAKVESKKTERPKPVKPAKVTPPAAQPSEKDAQEKTDGDGDNGASALSKRVWLGVEPVEVDEAVRDYLELTEGFGVGIQHVVNGSPAEKAGLQVKDILLRLDDQRLTTPRHLQVLVATYQKGDVIELTILRKGRQSVLKTTLGESDLPLLSMWPEEPAEFEIVDPSIPNVEPGVPRIARLGQDAVQQRIADYRAAMQKWMKQPSATRGPSPTLNLQAPKVASQGADAVGAKPSVEKSGDNKNKVEINASGVKISGGPSITIGHGASIRAGGGVVKINNANGSVSVRTVDEKPIIEIHDGDGKLIHSGPYQRSDDMIEKLPANAQAVLKKMNLNNLNLLNIQVGGQ